MVCVLMFDLDGTLVDTSVDLTEALNYAGAPYRLPKMTPALTKAMVGEGVSRLVEKMLGEEWAHLKRPVLESFLSYYSDHLSVFSRPYPGVIETIAGLAGIRKAVVSNKMEGLSKRLLDDVGLGGYFDMIIGSDSVGEEKPSPKPLLHVLRTLSCQPVEALIIGDSSFDIEAGKAAGVRSIAVTYGFRAATELTAADFVIDDIRQLPGLLQGIG